MKSPIPEVRIIFAEEVRRAVRRRSYVLTTLAVPALLLLALAAVPLVRSLGDRQPPKEDKPAGLVSLSPAVTFAGGAPPGFAYLDTREAGLAALAGEDYAIDELFIVTEDYLETGAVEWLNRGGGLLSGFDPGPGMAQTAVVDALLRVAVAGSALPPERLQRALVPAVMEPIRIGPDGQPVEEDPGRDVAAFFAALGGSIVLVILIVANASSLAVAVAEEKENRMIEVILTSARPFSIMAGKVLALGVSGLIMIGVWTASVVLIVPRIFDIVPDLQGVSLDPVILLWTIAFFLAGYFISAVVLAGLGAASASVREATQLAGLIVLPLIVPVYAILPLLSDPDGPLPRALSFIPFTAPTTMVLRLAVGQPTVVETAASLLVTVATGVVLLWLSARVFRAGLLLYGQRMSPRRLWTALRGAD